MGKPEPQTDLQRLFRILNLDAMVFAVLLIALRVGILSAHNFSIVMSTLVFWTIGEIVVMVWNYFRKEEQV